MAAVCAAVVSVLPAQDNAAPAAASRAAATADGSPPSERVHRPMPSTGLVVGIVDLGKAFDLYPRTIKERERLQKLADNARDQIDKVSKRIQELRGTIEILKEGSFERDAKQLDLELAMNERQGLAKLLNDQMQLETMRMQLSIYEDLDAAIQRLAKDRGVHLVMRTEVKDTAPPENGDKASPKSVQNRVFAYERRQVWFAAEELDLTADLIKLLQVWPLESSKDAPASPPSAGDDKAGGGGGR